VLGVLSVATMPVAIVATRYSGAYDLLHAGFAIPIALALGFAALAGAQRARARDGFTLGRAGGRSAARAGRALGLLGVCIASAGVVSLLVYALLKSVE
jgi:ABC-type Fe3+ transport system permease subunit